MPPQTLAAVGGDMERRSKVFAAESGSVRGARDFVRSAITDLGLNIADAALLTSELVSNAVEHAASEIEVVVTANAETLRVEVHDGFIMTEAFRVVVDTQVPAVDSCAPRGRGLMIVRGAATRFGVLDKSEGGKAVWFEFELA